MLRVLLLLEHAFMAWMLIDAIRRRADGYWYLIIFVPFGEWYYFLRVKMQDRDMQWLRDLLHREKPPSLDQVRFEYEQTPSQANRIRLGQALHDADRFAEGAELFAEVLAGHPDDRDALQGSALCKIGLGDFEGAISHLERLIEVDRAFNDYQPWIHLSQTLWRVGRRDDALALLDRLVEVSPRLGHAVALAHFQNEAERPQAARHTLREALRYFEHAPKFFKRENRGWARQARRMLKALG